MQAFNYNHFELFVKEKTVAMLGASADDEIFQEYATDFFIYYFFPLKDLLADMKKHKNDNIDDYMSENVGDSIWTDFHNDYEVLRDVDYKVTKIDDMLTFRLICHDDVGIFCRQIMDYMKDKWTKEEDDEFMYFHLVMQKRNKLLITENGVKGVSFVPEDVVKLIFGFL